MRKTIVAVALLLPMFCGPVARADTIRVQSTTDTVDAGLVNGIDNPDGSHTKGLIDLYKAAHPEDTVQYTAVGTGKAIDNAKNGQADLVITHAASLEKQFVDGGYAYGQGRQIFYSDYVIVGPTADPAGVATADRHDAVGAFEAIAAAGVAGKATFVSRGDNSGTNVQEENIWGLTGAGVAKVDSTNPSHLPAQKKPADTSWYVASAAGQAANVQRTSVCAASTYPKGGCYTMVDRGTYNRLVNAGTVTNLKIVADQNTGTARGGADLLINPFGAYVLNPKKTYPGGVTPNVAAAQRFIDFIVSPAFQQYLETFPTAVDPAFRPDSLPDVTLSTPLPRTAERNATLRVAGSLANRLPGGDPVGALKVKLQASTDGGRTFETVASATTSASGGFRLAATLAATTTYRLATPVAAASDHNFFTAGTSDLGRVRAVKDRTRPTVSHISLRSRSLSLQVTEASTTRVLVQRAGRVVKTLRLRTNSGRTVSHRFSALAAGSYRVSVVSRDRAGNVRRLTRTRRVGG